MNKGRSVKNRYPVRHLAQIILYNDKQEVYLQHRDSKAPTYPNAIGLFGGGIEPGETARKAVIRECGEETSYQLKQPRLLDKREYSDGKYRGLSYVYIEKYDGAAKLECHEGKAGLWLSRERVEKRKKVIDLDKRILDKFFKTIPLICISASLFLCQPAFAELQIEGEWDTSQGALAVTRLPNGEVQASYAQGEDQGRITGRLENTRLTGTWVETSSGKRCELAVDGSYYWGRVQFDFSRDSSTFTGVWGYCQEALVSPWKGKRIGAAPSSAPAKQSPVIWVYGLLAVLLCGFLGIFIIFFRRKKD